MKENLLFYLNKILINKIKLMKKVILLLFALALFSGCTKMEEKKSSSQTSQQQQTGQMPQAQAPNEDAMKLSKEAFEFDKVYEKDKSQKNKQELIKRHLEAGLILSPNQDMSHMNKESIRLSYKHLKRVLEIDPNNKDAQDAKQMIEDMYKQIGKPVPEDQ